MLLVSRRSLKAYPYLQPSPYCHREFGMVYSLALLEFSYAEISCGPSWSPKCG